MSKRKLSAGKEERDITNHRRPKQSSLDDATTAGEDEGDYKGEDANDPYEYSYSSTHINTSISNAKNQAKQMTLLPYVCRVERHGSHIIPATLSEFVPGHIVMAQWSDGQGTHRSPAIILYIHLINKKSSSQDIRMHLCWLKSSQHEETKFNYIDDLETKDTGSLSIQSAKMENIDERAIIIKDDEEVINGVLEHDGSLRQRLMSSSSNVFLLSQANLQRWSDTQGHLFHPHPLKGDLRKVFTHWFPPASANAASSTEAVPVESSTIPRVGYSLSEILQWKQTAQRNVKSYTDILDSVEVDRSRDTSLLQCKTVECQTTSEDVYQQITQLAKWPCRIVFIGEQTAGKSYLINATLLHGLTDKWLSEASFNQYTQVWKDPNDQKNYGAIPLCCGEGLNNTRCIVECKFGPKVCLERVVCSAEEWKSRKLNGMGDLVESVTGTEMIWPTGNLRQSTVLEEDLVQVRKELSACNWDLFADGEVEKINHAKYIAMSTVKYVLSGPFKSCAPTELVESPAIFVDTTGLNEPDQKLKDFVTEYIKNCEPDQLIIAHIPASFRQYGIRQLDGPMSVDALSLLDPLYEMRRLVVMVNCKQEVLFDRNECELPLPRENNTHSLRRWLQGFRTRMLNELSQLTQDDEKGIAAREKAQLQMNEAQLLLQGLKQPNSVLLFGRIPGYAAYGHQDETKVQQSIWTLEGYDFFEELGMLRKQERDRFLGRAVFQADTNFTSLSVDVSGLANLLIKGSDLFSLINSIKTLPVDIPSDQQMNQLFDEALAKELFEGTFSLKHIKCTITQHKKQLDDALQEFLVSGQLSGLDPFVSSLGVKLEKLTSKAMKNFVENVHCWTYRWYVDQIKQQLPDEEVEHNEDLPIDPTTEPDSDDDVEDGVDQVLGIVIKPSFNDLKMRSKACRELVNDRKVKFCYNNCNAWWKETVRSELIESFQEHKEILGNRSPAPESRAPAHYTLRPRVDSRPEPPSLNMKDRLSDSIREVLTRIFTHADVEDSGDRPMTRQHQVQLSTESDIITILKKIAGETITKANTQRKVFSAVVAFSKASSDKASWEEEQLNNLKATAKRVKKFHQDRVDFYEKQYVLRSDMWTMLSPEFSKLLTENAYSRIQSICAEWASDSSTKLDWKMSIIPIVVKYTDQMTIDDLVRQGVLSEGDTIELDLGNPSLFGSRKKQGTVVHSQYLQSESTHCIRMSTTIMKSASNEYAEMECIHLSDFCTRSVIECPGSTVLDMCVAYSSGVRMKTKAANGEAFKEIKVPEPSDADLQSRIIVVEERHWTKSKGFVVKCPTLVAEILRKFGKMRIDSDEPHRHYPIFMPTKGRFSRINATLEARSRTHDGTGIEPMDEDSGVVVIVVEPSERDRYTYILEKYSFTLMLVLPFDNGGIGVSRSITVGYVADALGIEALWQIDDDLSHLTQLNPSTGVRQRCSIRRGMKYTEELLGKVKSMEDLNFQRDWGQDLIHNSLQPRDESVEDPIVAVIRHFPILSDRLVERDFESLITAMFDASSSTSRSPAVLSRFLLAHDIPARSMNEIIVMLYGLHFRSFAHITAQISIASRRYPQKKKSYSEIKRHDNFFFYSSNDHKAMVLYCAESVRAVVWSG